MVGAKRARRVAARVLGAVRGSLQRHRETEVRDRKDVRGGVRVDGHRRLAVELNVPPTVPVDWRENGLRSPICRRTGRSSRGRANWPAGVGGLLAPVRVRRPRSRRPRSGAGRFPRRRGQRPDTGSRRRLEARGPRPTRGLRQVEPDVRRDRDQTRAVSDHHRRYSVCRTGSSLSLFSLGAVLYSGAPATNR